MNRLFLLGVLPLAALAEPVKTYTIPNDLRLEWPSDLVSLPAPKLRTEPGSVFTLTVEGHERPAQFAKAPDGSGILWSVVTAAEKTDDIVAELNLRPENFLPADVRLHVDDGKDFYTVSNGLYEFRLRKYAGRLPDPVALEGLPHWCAGMRPAGTEEWDGQGAFAGGSRVVSAETSLLETGPVFADFRVRLVFEGAEQADGTVPTLPLANGKQTHLWKPAEIPLQDLPKLDRTYEARIRFVWNDPWIDVDERYRLPADGTHRHTLAWGAPADGVPKPAFAKVDTVTWVRWFEWDVFGGNVDQKWVPAEPRPAQKGRPFALLRPVWNQGGGGAQDFFLTRGGTDGAGSADAPMYGVVAAFASKWMAPYAQTIEADAFGGNRGECRFPLGDGAEAGAWYGRRGYGLCCGPRGRFPSLNNLVRRHTDWTLDAQANRYILRWAGRAEKPSARAPDCGLYLERRYQDDFLNPTQHTTRRLKNYRDVAPGSCGAAHAALGYIVTDLDSWPGWHSGWRPGNPNFHTDKYMGAIYIASAMPGHPHAKDWLAYGLANYHEDQERVFTQPDGVGYECPGYAGYSMNLQLDIAASLLAQGVPAAEVIHPRLVQSARWHRKLLTPVDPRLGFRHEAPIGDTHRWTSGIGVGFGKLALLVRDFDPAAAAEFRAAGDELARTGGLKRDDWDKLLDEGLRGIAPSDFAALDWSSQAFGGFGAVLRDAFGTPRESFVSIKAGALGGHYHHDDLSFHAYLDGCPAALDYNCSYAPRGDHAALHNALTFGQEATLRHNGSGRDIAAFEQCLGRAADIRFLPGKRADVLVAERTVSDLELSPVLPDDAEFGRGYPRREVPPFPQCRTVALVKPARGSKMPAYLVVRDEADGAEPVQLNLHLLARSIEGDGPVFRAPGQWNRDFSVFLAHAEPEKVERREWHYFAAREFEGKPLVPPSGTTGPWIPGEQQQWLRIHLPPKTDATWILFANDPAETPPAFGELPDGHGVRVSYRGQTDEIRFEEDGSVSVRPVPMSTFQHVP